MKIGEPKIPTSEELAEEKRRHMISDAELLKDGADLYPNGTVYPTLKQINEAKNEVIGKNEFAQVVENELFPLTEEEDEIRGKINELEEAHGEKLKKIREIEKNYTLTSRSNRQSLDRIFKDLKPDCSDSRTSRLILNFDDLEEGDLSELVSSFSQEFGEGFDKESFLKRLKVKTKTRQGGEIKEADIFFNDNLILQYHYWNHTTIETNKEFYKMFITLAMEHGVVKIGKSADDEQN